MRDNVLAVIEHLEYRVVALGVVCTVFNIITYIVRIVRVLINYTGNLEVRVSYRPPMVGYV